MRAQLQYRQVKFSQTSRSMTTQLSTTWKQTDSEWGWLHGICVLALLLQLKYYELSYFPCAWYVLLWSSFIRNGRKMSLRFAHSCVACVRNWNRRMRKFYRKINRDAFQGTLGKRFAAMFWRFIWDDMRVKKQSIDKGRLTFFSVTLSNQQAYTAGDP